VMLRVNSMSPAIGAPAHGVPPCVEAPAVAVAPTSFRAVFEAHAAFVWRTVRRLGVREADLPDVCQEVFVVLSRRMPALDLSRSPRAWLFSVAARVAADHRRRAYVRYERPSEEVALAGGPAPQLTALAQKEARATLDRILDGLEEDQRAVFILYELEQLPMSEIAQAVASPLQTCYSRLHAARAKVEAAIARCEKGARP